MYSIFGVKFMKRIFTFLLSISIIFLSFFSSVLTAFAADSIKFECTNQSCNTNRLVTFDIIAECSKNLCAATFEFSYDKSMFEFRSVKSADSSSTVKANEQTNNVKVVYLNTYGQNIDGGKTIFSLTLKAIKSGTGYIDFSVNDCVDKDVKSLSVGNCTSAKITVYGSNVSGNESSNKSNYSNGSKNKSNKSDSYSGKSSRGDDSEVLSDSAINEMGVINPIDDKNTKFLIAGIIIGAAIIAFILIAFSVGRHSVKKTTKNQNADIKKD